MQRVPRSVNTTRVTDRAETTQTPFRPGAPRRRIAAGIVLGAILASVVLAWWWMIHVPGSTHDGALPPATEAMRALEQELRADVTRIAELGPRNARHEPALAACADDLERELTKAGYRVRRVSYRTGAQQHHNLEAVLEGTATKHQNVVIGAHYDSATSSPGANDNASGVAAMLALARRFAREPQQRTVRFVAFADEEPPSFQTDRMGSLVYARTLERERVYVVAMLSLESLGYYRWAEGSQSYPFPLSLFYPSRGNFVAFVSDTRSRGLLHRAIGAFRRHARFPSEGGALPGSMPGVGWSDHWSFWQTGDPALMVTDTAPFRDPHYHTPRDTADRLDYGRMARVVEGLRRVVGDLARGPRSW